MGAERTRLPRLDPGHVPSGGAGRGVGQGSQHHRRLGVRAGHRQGRAGRRRLRAGRHLAVLQRHSRGRLAHRADPGPGARGRSDALLSAAQEDYDILDTWHAAGLKATGSNDVRIHRAFVPDEFTLNVSIADGRPTPGSALSDSHIYRLPLWSVFSYNIGTPALGMARAALEGYIAASAGRPDREVAQGRHARIAESAADIDAAEALLLADCEEITRLGRSGEPIAVETRARWRRNMAYAVNVWTRAVDRLIGSVGAHGMSENSPVQRAFRDIHAVGNHTGLVWDNHGPLWGRIAMGLEPASIRALPIPV